MPEADPAGVLGRRVLRLEAEVRELKKIIAVAFGRQTGKSDVAAVDAVGVGVRPTRLRPSGALLDGDDSGQPVEAEASPRKAAGGSVGGLAGAIARGEAARVAWVRDGSVVPIEKLAEAWGLTRQALGPAAKRGELFVLKIGNRTYVPKEFLLLEREIVARVNTALGGVSPSSKFVFWTRAHGALAGKAVVDALSDGATPERVVALAAAWAQERGPISPHVAIAAEAARTGKTSSGADSQA
jgi:hypothetical protein